MTPAANEENSSWPMCVNMPRLSGSPRIWLRATPSAVANSGRIKTSSTTTMPIDQSASGPRARVSPSTASVTEGDRVKANVPHKSATASNAPGARSAVKGTTGDSAQNTSATPGITMAICASAEAPTLIHVRRSTGSVISAPACSAISASASVFTSVSALTSWLSRKPIPCGPAARPASR